MWQCMLTHKIHRWNCVEDSLETSLENRCCKWILNEVSKIRFCVNRLWQWRLPQPKPLKLELFRNYDLWNSRCHKLLPQNSNRSIVVEISLKVCWRSAPLPKILKNLYRNKIDQNILAKPAAKRFATRFATKSQRNKKRNKSLIQVFWRVTENFAESYLKFHSITVHTYMT